MSCADRVQSSSRGLFAEVVRLQRAGECAVLAVPLWSRGSVPMSAHAKLLVRQDGSIQGTIGGGRLEAEVIAAARGVLREGRHRVMEFDLSAAEAAETGMVCGGRCAVLLELIVPDRGAEVFAAATEAEAAGEAVAIVTILPADGVPGKVAVTAEGRLIGTAGTSQWDESLRLVAQAALSDGRARFVQEPARAVVDPILPRPSVIIFGAGHIGVCLAQIAGFAGFRVVVVDDREEFANVQRFPRADEVIAASVAQGFSRLEITESTYIVAVTRGHASDEEVVARALGTPARYIGMIGSKRKVALLRERLRAGGISEEDIGRLHAPIGLEIGAEGVEEIAVSILAELIAVRRGVARR